MKNKDEAKFYIWSFIQNKHSHNTVYQKSREKKTQFFAAPSIGQHIVSTCYLHIKLYNNTDKDQILHICEIF